MCFGNLGCDQTIVAYEFDGFEPHRMAYRCGGLCAAIAVGLLSRTAQLLQPADENPVFIPAATALTFAFSLLFWSQAVITEVYTLLVLFASLLVWLLIRWRNGAGAPTLWLASFALGLGLGSHLTLVFVAPAALVLLWPERQRWFRARVLLPAFGAFLLASQNR